ncbi:hypothetical protein GCM10022243_58570 [Saccharothrix violaceirubra]|uniref:Ligand-binding SRPBCC domain-containing protein n=1 Tax=Saccharothrix violaceirubra TaxID=413306 RepID=A0A7W7T457_9PSEU|nr:SRPBCC family protein [Saccharothrix violaceirubra]MBB4965712.1 ligand-binding SRPBCC domain-containing protein [Saccharothrix violaceirubra]
MTRFEVVTAIAAPPTRVFELCLDIATHTALGERVVGSAGGVRDFGDTITFEARHLGLRWRMTARVVVHSPPGLFVDEQVSGPFRRWRHEHRFASDGDGGTVMHDLVDFAAPLGPLGRLVERVVLDRYLPRLVRVRHDHVKSVAERR